MSLFWKEQPIIEKMVLIIEQNLKKLISNQF